LSGGKLGAPAALAPSPDKGRVGEGLAQHRPFIPYDPRLTALARANRKNPTPAETRLWNQVLRQRQFSQYKFLRQKPIDRFIVDFYCSALRLVIEVDGDSHAGLAEADAERSRILASHALTVLRYANRDILGNIDGVYADLLRWLQDNPGPT
jgi:very-short-patch-repair endonuclease